jgi:hypothetical protein
MGTPSVASSEPAGPRPSHNNAVSAGVYMVRVPDLVPEIIVPTVHHIPLPGASTAREKGSAGPAQERRDSGTLYAIWPVGRRPALRGRGEFGTPRDYR